jgi:hypothetical protein
MVAGNSSAIRIEKCEGYRVRGFAASGKKRYREQNSRDDEPSKAMKYEPMPIGAADCTTQSFDSGG